MKYLRITILVAALLLNLQIQPQAYCFSKLDYRMDIATYSTGKDSAIIVDISEITNPKNVQPFKDTLLPSHLLSRLKAEYDTSNFVVVAHISEYKSYWPELKTIDVVYYQTEEVTITIDTILKGTIKQHTKNMTNIIKSRAQRLRYDTLRNAYETVTMFLSEEEQGYGFIKDKRFLIFAQNEDQCFKLPLLGVCVFSTGAYVIDTNNQIYYDGTEIDFANKQINNIPNLKLQLQAFIDNIKSVRTVNKINIKEKSKASGNSVSAFNLLGKKMAPITSYDFLTNHSSSLLLINSHGEKGCRTKHLLINNN